MTITEQGFEPATVTVRPEIPTRLTFIRKTDKTCATEVVFPSLAIRRGLPLNEPTVIEFTPGCTRTDRIRVRHGHAARDHCGAAVSGGVTWVGPDFQLGREANHKGSPLHEV